MARGGICRFEDLQCFDAGISCFIGVYVVCSARRNALDRWRRTIVKPSQPLFLKCIHVDGPRDTHDVEGVTVFACRTRARPYARAAVQGLRMEQTEAMA